MSARAAWAGVIAGAAYAACVACAVGCASGPDARDDLTASFASAEARHARELAPDLYGRAEQARAAAQEHAGAARSEQERAAQLWLQAAFEEAERIELERARRGHEARAETAVVERAKHDRERVAIEEELKREQAARIARAEAARVFALAVESEEQPRKRTALREEAREEAARWLLARARLTLSTARALGLPEAQAAEHDAAIARAAAPQKQAGALDAAKVALAGAERALGEARAVRPAPSAPETASLLEMAVERGLRCAALERGVAIEVGGAFAGSNAQLAAGGLVLSRHVAAVLRAFPHGPVRIEILPAGPAAQRKRAEARGRALAAAIAREAAAGDASGPSATAARIEVVDAIGDLGAEAPLIVLGAYAPR